jgi:hypothetical protein
VFEFSPIRLMPIQSADLRKDVHARNPETSFLFWQTQVLSPSMAQRYRVDVDRNGSGAKPSVIKCLLPPMQWELANQIDGTDCPWICCSRSRNLHLRALDSVRFTQGVSYAATRRKISRPRPTFTSPATRFGHTCFLGTLLGTLGAFSLGLLRKRNENAARRRFFRPAPYAKFRPR